MLPVILAHSGNIVQADEFTRPIDERGIRTQLMDLNQRWKNKLTTSYMDEDDYGAADATTGLNSLHAEVIVKTSETDEGRANELLNLTEQAIIRTIGSLSLARVETSVVTDQKTTETTLVIYRTGLELAKRAFGLLNVADADMEDFLVKKAATEYRALLLRFYNTNILNGDKSPKLEVKLEATGRTLKIQRSHAAFISKSQQLF